MHRYTTLPIAAALVATAALAHQGVQNPAVKARMNLMVEVKEATATIGGMVKGAIPFDADRAAQARADLIDHARQIPAAFQARETDPASEARPEIWTDWDGFTQAAEEMEQAATAIDTSDHATLQDGLRKLGASCSGCHKPYRISK